MMQAVENLFSKRQQHKIIKRAECSYHLHFPFDYELLYRVYLNSQHRILRVPPISRIYFALERDIYKREAKEKRDSSERKT